MAAESEILITLQFSLIFSMIYLSYVAFTVIIASRPPVITLYARSSLSELISSTLTTRSYSLG